MTKPIAIDLFCGAGGASLGIHQAGVHRVMGYDNWPVAVETHKANGLPAKCVDLSERMPKIKSEVDLVWASCPCQPFTSALITDGMWDERDGFPHYLRVLERYMPRLTIFENVAGLTYKRHANYLQTIIESVEKLGYEISYKVVNAADYKIPQSRRRFILIGRLDDTPRWPKRHPKKVVTVRDALGTDGKGQPRGTKVVYTKNPMLRGGERGGLLFNGRGRPLDPDRPSLTIYASGGNHVHWFDTKGEAHKYYVELVNGGPNRTGIVKGAKRLTVEQMARLQGFPEDFVFCGPPSAQVKQIGNAVPPRLAYLLVKMNS